MKPCLKDKIALWVDIRNQAGIVLDDFSLGLPELKGDFQAIWEKNLALLSCELWKLQYQPARHEAFLVQ